jgi:tRNA pseudouridine55 synthase
MTSIDGVAVIDKPAGLTSHDVVAQVRRALGTRKVGHAGTLDPMATGVLVIGVGRATRLLGYLSRTQKAYAATIRLGSATTSDDAMGEAITVCEPSHLAALTDEGIIAAINTFVGEISQIPSAVSAVKVDGKRAHARIRAGETVQLEPRMVRVTQFDVRRITRLPEAIDVDVDVTCSSGTYIRALARDLGDLLSVGGHLTALRRTRVGTFDSPVQLAAFLEEPKLLSLGEAVSGNLPTHVLNDADTRLVRNGVRITWPADLAPMLTALVASSGELIALAEPAGTDMGYPVVFHPGGPS